MRPLDKALRSNELRKALGLVQRREIRRGYRGATGERETGQKQGVSAGLRGNPAGVFSALHPLPALEFLPFPAYP